MVERRLVWLVWIFLGWTIAILLRLVSLQIIHHQEYAALRRDAPNAIERSAPRNVPPSPPPAETHPKPHPATPDAETRATDSMRHLRFFEWVRADPVIATPVIATVSALLVSLFNIILWPGMRGLFGYLWDRVLSAISGRRTEDRYLDAIIQQNRFLRVLPSTLVPITSENSRQELDDVYIALAATGQRGYETPDLGTAVHQFDRIVLLGDPGSGKTTTLRFLTLVFARTRRKRPSSRQAEDRRIERSNIANAVTKVTTEFGFSKPPLPVFVELNRWHDILEASSAQSLHDLLRDTCQGRDAIRDFNGAFFDRQWRKGRCIFLFDALDELGSASARDKAAQLIGEFASSSPPGNRFIISSRVVGYSGQMSSHGFQVLKIQPLSQGLVRTLVTKWYAALEQPQVGEQLLEVLQTRPRLYDLAANPMLLSIIALVQYVRHTIPERRHVLYKECIEILLERRYAPVQVQDDYNSVLPYEEATSILQGVAAYLHEHRIREIARSRLESKIVPKLIETIGSLSHAANLPPARVIRNIEERSQLLTERGIDEMGAPVMALSHLTFQEFLVSRHFLERALADGYDAVSNRLIENYRRDAEWWEEVVLLYAAQLGPAQQPSFLARFQVAGN